MAAQVHYEPVRQDLVAALAAHYDEADVRRYLWDNERVTVEMVEPIVAASAASFSTAGWGFWAMLDGPGGPLVGTIGLRHVPGHDSRVEVLYSLTRSWWGRGVATAAARMAVQRGFESGLDEILGGVDEGNDRSVAVLGRLGMRPIGSLEVYGSPVPYYAVDRSSFRR